jgi:hypothetical protein
VFGFPVTVGAWAGTWHFDVGGGIAGGGCPEPTCRSTEKDSTIDYANAFPLFGGVRRNVFERGEIAVGLGLRYRALHLAADTLAGHVSFWSHGPVASPYVAFTSPSFRGLGGMRASAIRVEVPVGYSMASEGRRALSIGANFAFQLTVF